MTPNHSAPPASCHPWLALVDVEMLSPLQVLVETPRSLDPQVTLSYISAQVQPQICL